MKKYEALKLHFSDLDSSDVISTSADVTTGEIVMPWQKSDVSKASFRLFDSIDESSYDVQ